MSTPEPAPAQAPAEPDEETPAPEPVQNRASRRAKPVKQAKPQHVGPRLDHHGKR